MKEVSNEPLRILQVGMHDKIGGVETFLFNYYKKIDKSKIQFDFINPYKKLCFENEIIKMGGKVYTVPNFKKHMLKYYSEIKKIIIDNKYNIIHVNMLSAANIIPLIAAKKAGAKVIIAHSHNNELPKNFLKRFLNRINKHYISKLSSTLFSCSDIAGKWMFGQKANFEVISNAIDFEKFKYNKTIREELRVKYNLKDKFVIGHIGRFSDQKNHSYLIDIFYEIKKERDDAVLLLVGEGELEEAVKQKVKKLKLNDSVIFYGVTKQTNELFQIFDLFLLPSKYEGLGIVLLEAQAAGLHCFTSKKVVPTSVNYSGMVQYIDLNEEPKKWAHKILNLKNFNKRKSAYSKYYDIEIQAKELENKYINLLKR